MNLQKALAKVVSLRSQSIVLRRGETSLPAQDFRVERLSKNRQVRGDASRERQADGVLMGAVDADVAVDDRFNADGLLWRISFVQPNRSVATIAEVQVIQ
jgi:hypothetical protein